MTAWPAIASLDTRFPRLDTCTPSVGRDQATPTYGEVLPQPPISQFLSA